MKLWGKPQARDRGEAGQKPTMQLCGLPPATGQCVLPLLLASVPPAVQYMAIDSVSVCGQALA